MNRLRAETTLTGLPVSKGIALARVCLFNETRHSNLPIYKVDGEGVQKEMARFERAVSVTGERLEGIREDVAIRVGKAEAEIFFAQKTILEDESVNARVKELITERKINAETAVTAALDGFEARILELDNEYIKERATDFGEVKRRLLDVLSNMNPGLQCSDQAHCQKGRDRIIVAQELTPTLTVDLDTAHTIGFVTERGGANSHAAILARALGIPAISNLTDIHSVLSCGTELLLDGYSGEVVVMPSDETVARVRAAHPQELRAPNPVDPVSGFRVLANVNGVADATLAVDLLAEGIGLYRTEFELINAGRMLDEDEQYERYAAVLKVMKDKPVVFRLFDIGGDKPAPFLQMPREDNPYLGWRGARFLLAREDLLAMQARALARAAQHGPVSVLYPMIVDLEQFRRLRSVFEKATGHLPQSNIRHGVMFEVPSACLDADALLAEADFGSIGTNDLIQYLFAVDRNNELVAYDYDPGRAVLWTLIAQVARAAANHGKEMSVCGEIAAEPAYISRLLGAGIRTVSVSPRLIPCARVAAAAHLEHDKRSS
ncbi:MAG: phosphoenolpyruvate--protein phosphotransferase [Lentisphaerales bacterium]|jgi:phosphotransferase system enzyme I (PtsI)|nr:MAG: phosphoenolpyruvate--protein phosphotransferase [Lentisphaerales bacterium]